MNSDLKEAVTERLRIYILAKDALRNNDASWKAFRPRRDTEDGKAYYALSEALKQADMELWNATDFEYDEDGFRDVIWEWRFLKVEVQKCCWSQSKGSTKWAGEMMAKLHGAEAAMVEACGLTELYINPCEYIEARFPKLCSL